MIPSERLRLLIEKIYNVDLEKYKWPEELQKVIFETNLDKDYEEYSHTLEDAYVNGFNIGHCGLTARYLARCFEKAAMHIGVLSLLVGTKRSTSGNHAWVELEKFLIDPTLMIIIPISKKEELGYKTKKVLAYDSARTLSEYDTYENEYHHKLNNEEEFNDSLYQIKH